MSAASIYQPAPVQGQEVVLSRVISSLVERAEVGKEKYGTYLETFNGRDALWDLWQELADGLMYLTQALMERETLAKEKESAYNIPMNILPLSNYLLIEPIENKQTESGLLLIQEEGSLRKGHVLAAGEGHYENGVFIRNLIQPGSIIFYRPRRDEVKLDGKVLISEYEAVAAVVEQR